MSSQIANVSAVVLFGVTPARRIVAFSQTSPEVVCLCGSTRFLEVEREEYKRLTLKGCIVLTHSGWRSPTKVTGDALDELHKRKIDLADRVHILNVGGYVGDSTRAEMAYAREHGKPITFLEHVA